jgi:Domain of unknown function (DUF4410)
MLMRICLLFFGVLIAGCAGATANTELRSRPEDSNRPTQIVVYPFAVDPSEVTLNQGILQRAYRNMSGENQDAEQTKIARATAENVCLGIIDALQHKGWNASCLERGTPAVGDNLLVVDGEFTDISEGNRLRRLVIGFGVGASALDAKVTMYQRTANGYQPLLEFVSHADSGKLPGAAVLGPAGAAAGAGVGAVVATNAAIGSAKSYRSSTGALASRTTKEVVDQLTGYFAQHGWGQNPSGN